MGFFTWLRQWATASNRATPSPRHPDLHPINVAKLQDELRLKEEAKRLGAGGIPAADAKALTGPEAAIVQRVETFRQGYFDWAVARLNLLSTDLGKLDITANVNRALHSDKEFEREATTMLSERDTELRALADSARKARAELDTFKAKHDLQHREARYPEGMTSFMLYALVGVLVVIEGALNANFFAHGLDSGWLGGLGYAVSLALLNVVIAFSLGKYVVRFMFHRHPALKLSGLLGLASAVGLILCIGLGIAHFRDALQAEVVDPARTAIETFKANPLGLRDMMSWVLLFVSAFFGAVALADGLFIDDPYPGYGKVSRRTQMVTDDYDTELEELREELEDLKQKSLTLLDDAVKAAQSTVAVYESRIDEKDAAALRLATALQNADNSMAALLSTFRSENELHRNGLARPRYFDEQPPLRQLPFPDFSTQADRAALTEHGTLVGRLVADVQTIRARIQESFNHQYDLLKPLGTQYRSSEAN